MINLLSHHSLGTGATAATTHFKIALIQNTVSTPENKAHGIGAQSHDPAHLQRLLRNEIRSPSELSHPVLPTPRGSNRLIYHDKCSGCSDFSMNDDCYLVADTKPKRKDPRTSSKNVFAKQFTIENLNFDKDASGKMITHARSISIHTKRRIRYR